MGGNKVCPNPALVDEYPDVYLSTGLVAENHARDYAISREEQDAFALRSHQRALAAIEAGRFAEEITPLTFRVAAPQNGPPNGGPRHARRDVRAGRGAAARHVHRGPREAAAGVSRHRHRHRGQLVADERRRGRGRRDVRRARRRSAACSRWRASSPTPRPASSRSASASDRSRPCARCWHRPGLTLDQIDLVELNEAFAAQVLACLRELPIDPERLNVNGGAIALGHPLGCTGAKLTTTLLYEMRRRNARYGLVTMCVGGGMGAAGIFERL